MQELYAQFCSCKGKVSTDSRKVEAGSMFFALRGDNFDGNQYAARALDQGAALCVVDDISVCDGSSRYVVVDDALGALQDLAAYHRTQLSCPIISLTGSNGKTTTKEFLRLALSAKFDNIGYTRGNLNNHIGVPLTLLSFTERTEIGIVEMGANHVGEIAALCAIARPDVGLITNVGRAHLEGFGGQQGIRRGKGELFDFLAANGGVAIYNEQDKVLCEMVSERKELNGMAYSTSGSGYSAPVFGAYNTFNALAAINIAVYFGVEASAAAARIDSYTPENNRSQIIESSRGNRLVVDCYNANPSSMSAAIAEFALIQSDSTKIVILGNMGELGSYSADEHKKIEVMVARQGFTAYFVGENWSVAHFGSTEELKRELAQNPIQGKTILLKGSRSVQLEKLIENL